MNEGAMSRDEALDRLVTIERLLGTVMLEGLSRLAQAHICEAWWESRSDVPRDDDLRALSLSEFKEFIHAK